MSFEAGTYRLTGCPKGGSSTTYRIGMNLDGDSFDTGNGATKTITTAVFNKNVWLIVYKGTTVNNLTFYPMLIKGTEDKPYEQYGASPSLDYPSEIETVGSNVNMYDEEKATQKAALIGRDGTIVSSNLTKVSDYIEITNDYYTVNYTNDSNTRGYSFFDKNKIFVSGDDGEKAPYTVARPQNAKYIRFSAPINANDVKLELGLIETPYSPFGMGGVEIDIVNKNLLNIANTEETTKGGITYSVKNGILKLNGTATAGLNIQLSKNIKIKKGKYTHSSSYMQLGLYVSFDNLMYSMISAQVGKKITFEITEDTTYKKYFIWIDKGTVLNNVEIKLQLEAGTTATDFVEHQSQSVIMPIQQEMLTGDYIKDVEHHEWGKIESYNNEEINTEYISTTGELSQGATVYYKLATPVNLELTEEQKVVRNQKLYTYKNITNISLSDELASVEVEYKKDLETMFNNIIKQMPSSTSDTTET